MNGFLLGMVPRPDHRRLLLSRTWLAGAHWDGWHSYHPHRWVLHLWHRRMVHERRKEGAS